MKSHAALTDVSVVIPIYNAAHVVGRAIASVQAQDHPVREILLVDDGSTDDLSSALERYGSEVSIIRQPVNLGAAAARNVGIHAAAGSLVAFLDADDEWETDKLTRQINFMRSHGVPLSCTGATRIFGAHGFVQSDVRPFPEIIGLEQFVWGCHVSPGTTLVAERTLLVELGGYDTGFHRFEDWDLLLRVALHDTPIGYLDESLATVHDSGPPSAEAATNGLGRMWSEHHANLRHRGRTWERRLEAAIAFEQAVCAWASGRRLATVRALARSFVRAPVHHLPTRLVLLPRLRREFHRAGRRARQRVSR